MFDFLEAVAGLVAVVATVCTASVAIVAVAQATRRAIEWLLVWGAR